MKKIFLVLFFIALVFPFQGCQSNKKPVVSVPPPAKNLKTIYFDFDASNIRNDQTTILNDNGGVMKSSSSLRVSIEGHCDERGTNEYNLALGDRRASSVRNYLVNLGVDPARMSTVSYGEERPVCTGHDESCWWQNRRGEFRKN